MRSAGSSAVALAVFVTTTVAGRPLEAEPVRERLAPVLLVLSAGGHTIDFHGGGAGLQLAIGNGRSYLVMGGRLAAGVNGETYYVPSGELGYRLLYRLDSGLTPTLLVAAGYGYILEGESARYHLPHGRIGGGLLFGRGARVNLGVEVSTAVGYAIHDNPRHGCGSTSWSYCDYSDVWLSLELSFVATF